jgi:hypothetical protein
VIAPARTSSRNSRLNCMLRPYSGGVRSRGDGGSRRAEPPASVSASSAALIITRSAGSAVPDRAGNPSRTLRSGQAAGTAPLGQEQAGKRQDAAAKQTEAERLAEDAKLAAKKAEPAEAKAETLDRGAEVASARSSASTVAKPTTSTSRSGSGARQLPNTARHRALGSALWRPVPPRSRPRSSRRSSRRPQLSSRS